MIQISVNDQSEQTLPINLNEFMAHRGWLDKKGLALAINDEVVPRSAWGQRVLQAGDRILLIQAAQGG